MPNCFSLSRKAEPTKPVRFVEIDAEICKHLDVPCDDVKYYLGWYDFVGWRLAIGKSLGEVKVEVEANVDNPLTPEMLKLVQYLIDNYTSDAWAEIGRRA